MIQTDGQRIQRRPLIGREMKTVEKCPKHYRPIMKDWKGERFCVECRVEKNPPPKLPPIPPSPPSRDLWNEPSLKTPEGKLAALRQAFWWGGYGVLSGAVVSISHLAFGSILGGISFGVALLLPPACGFIFFLVGVSEMKRRR